jgi:MoxR-like ATPase
VLRHRIVLSYDALSEGVSVDELLNQILAAVPAPGTSSLMRQDVKPLDISAAGGR